MTVWMNLTTSANWRRPPVGIVRVERSLSVELAKLYGDCFRYCIWQDNKFVEWSPKLETNALDNSGHNNVALLQPVSEDPNKPIFPILTKRKALVALGQGCLSLMPKKLQPHFNRLLYALRPRVDRLLMHRWSKHFLVMIRGKAPQTEITAQHAVDRMPEDNGLFSSGDVLISLGLDWDYPFYKEFYFLRKHHGIKVVTCCYDLIPVLYPQYCVHDVAGLFASYFLEVADGSDLVLCISRQTENDLNELLNRTGGARPSTHVFPLGDNVPIAGTEEISSPVKAICQEPFILFVSTIERRKNHEVLYRAYHLLCAQGNRGILPKLVFVGMQGWGVSELLKDIELDPLTRNMIIRLNHVTDTELRFLYDQAKFCVFPSLYEGWGLPVGEALSIGKAVICSNRGSLPEVGGKLVRYVDPWNSQAWAEEILRMVTDDVWREYWEENAKKQYQAKTWTDAALSIHRVIHEELGV